MLTKSKAYFVWKAFALCKMLLLALLISSTFFCSFLLSLSLSWWTWCSVGGKVVWSGDFWVYLYILLDLMDSLTSRMLLLVNVQLKHVIVKCHSNCPRRSLSYPANILHKQELIKPSILGWLHFFFGYQHLCSTNTKLQNLYACCEFQTYKDMVHSLCIILGQSPLKILWLTACHSKE